MNTAEKLRFLADRVEDGKEFYIGGLNYAYRNSVLFKMFGDGCASLMSLNTMPNHTLKIKPQWTFTDDEKAILRNLPDECRWIARDKMGWLQLFLEKPKKRNSIWYEPNWTTFSLFDKSFQSIKWEDEEPCEFRKYL